MFSQNFQPGDWVIFRKLKYSTSPGRRAVNIQPSSRGEQYAYSVDKFWLVEETRQDGTLVLRTRRGKKRLVAGSDPNLRRAGMLDRLFHGTRFPD